MTVLDAQSDAIGCGTCAIAIQTIRDEQEFAQEIDQAVQLQHSQARHATLVCLAVKEMNELRFVLVPKRLADEQFWAIYFALTRSRLPPEAFDVELQHRLAAEEAPPEKPKVRSLVRRLH